MPGRAGSGALRLARLDEWHRTRTDRRGKPAGRRIARGHDARLWLLVGLLDLVLRYGVGVVAQPILRWSEGPPLGKAEVVEKLREQGVRA